MAMKTFANVLKWDDLWDFFISGVVSFGRINVCDDELASELLLLDSLNPMFVFFLKGLLHRINKVVFLDLLIWR